MIKNTVHPSRAGYQGSSGLSGLGTTWISEENELPTEPGCGVLPAAKSLTIRGQVTVGTTFMSHPIALYSCATASNTGYGKITKMDSRIGTLNVKPCSYPARRRSAFAFAGSYG